jgi:hypothetical protein
MRLSISSTASATFHNPHFHSPDFDRFISVHAAAGLGATAFSASFHFAAVVATRKEMRIEIGRQRSEDGPRAHGVFEHYAQARHTGEKSNKNNVRQRLFKPLVGSSNLSPGTN